MEIRTNFECTIYLHPHNCIQISNIKKWFQRNSELPHSQLGNTQVHVCLIK